METFWREIYFRIF